MADKVKVIYQSRTKRHWIMLGQSDIGVDARGRIVDPKHEEAQFQNFRFSTDDPKKIAALEARPDFSKIEGQGMFWRYTPEVAEAQATRALIRKAAADMAADTYMDTGKTEAAILALAARREQRKAAAND